MNTIFSGSFTAIATNIAKLYAVGARKFLFPNAPDLSKTPAIMALGEDAVNGAAMLTGGYNAQLEAVLRSLAVLPGVEIVRVDFFGKVGEMAGSPDKFGLTVVNAACVTPNIPPYTCHEADEYMFWDGIHPTRTVHGIIAQTAASALSQ